jgi:hypothetical protein
LESIKSWEANKRGVTRDVVTTVAENVAVVGALAQGHESRLAALESSPSGGPKIKAASAFLTNPTDGDIVTVQFNAPLVLTEDVLGQVQSFSVVSQDGVPTAHEIKFPSTIDGKPVTINGVASAALGTPPTITIPGETATSVNIKRTVPDGLAYTVVNFCVRYDCQVVTEQTATSGTHNVLDPSPEVRVAMDATTTSLRLVYMPPIKRTIYTDGGNTVACDLVFAGGAYTTQTLQGDLDVIPAHTPCKITWIPVGNNGGDALMWIEAVPVPVFDTIVGGSPGQIRMVLDRAELYLFDLTAAGSDIINFFNPADYFVIRVDNSGSAVDHEIRVKGVATTQWGTFGSTPAISAGAQVTIGVARDASTSTWYHFQLAATL